MHVVTKELIDIIVTDRARETFGDVSKLAESIAEHGLLQPIVINTDNKLLAGGRRLKAHEELNLTTIDCKVIDTDDPLIIELIENQDRKDFEWHEEVLLKSRIHADLEATHKNWSLRKTAGKLHCAIGGLSSDLAIAAALHVFPHLKTLSSKAKARDAYKKLSNQAVAANALNDLPEVEKAKLNAMLTGTKNPVGKTVQDTPSDKHTSTETDERKGVGANVPAKKETAGNDPVGTHPDSPENVLPEFYYHIGTFQELFKDIPDNTVGFAELDPPYAIDYNNVYGKLNDIKQTATDWTVAQLKDNMRQLFLTLYDKMLDNSWVLCWTGKEHFNLMNVLASDAGFTIQPPGVWTKESGSSNTPKTTMVSQYEMFLLMRKGKAQFNTASFPSVINHSTVPASQRGHQWEKPLGLYNKFQAACGRPGSIFVAPFAGSGMSMISAAINGMTPMGSDTDNKYFPRFIQQMKNYCSNSNTEDKE